MIILFFLGLSWPSLASQDIHSFSAPYSVKDFDKEIKRVQGALKEDGSDEQAFRLRTRLAILYRIKDSPVKAKNLLEKNISLLKGSKEGDKFWMARSLEELGEIHFYAKDLERARKYWEHALKIRKRHFPGEKEWLAWSLSRMARYHSEMVNIDSAFHYAERALKMIRGSKETAMKKGVHVPGIYNEYAYALKVKKGQRACFKARETARAFLDSALILARKQYGKRNLYNAEIYHDIGNTYFDQAHYCKKAPRRKYVEKAETFYQKAIALRRQITPESRQKLAMTFFVRGLLYKKIPDLENALKYYSKATSLLTTGDPPQNRNKFDPPPFSSQVFNKALLIKVLTYKAKIFYQQPVMGSRTEDLRKALDHLRLAVRYWDSLMKDYESEDLYRTFGIYHPPFPDAMAVADSLYRRTGDHAYMKEAFILSEKGKNITYYRNKLIEQDARLKDTQGSLKPGNTTTLSEVQSGCEKEEAVVEYYYGFRNFYVFWCDPDTTRLYRKEVSRSDLHQGIRAYRKSITKRDQKGFKKWQGKLDSLLIAPIRPHLRGKVRKLRVIPHGMLATIPFDIFPGRRMNETTRDQRYLLNDHQISYGLSCTVLANKNKTYRNSKGCSFLAYAPHHSEKSGLPFSTELLGHLKEKYKGRFYKGNVTRDMFTRARDPNTILHLATHANADEVNPERSALWFSDTALYLNEVYDLPKPVSLVTLSACETGYGKYFTGEGVISFIQAFSNTGSGSVVGTLWKVDDRSTNRILKEFYQNVEARMPLDKALRQAKLKFMKETDSKRLAHPFYWAGPVLYGKVEKLEMRTKESKSWPPLSIWLGFGIGGLFFAGFLFFRRYKGSFP